MERQEETVRSEQVAGWRRVVMLWTQGRISNTKVHLRRSYEISLLYQLLKLHTFMKESKWNQQVIGEIEPPQTPSSI